MRVTTPSSYTTDANDFTVNPGPVDVPVRHPELRWHADLRGNGQPAPRHHGQHHRADLHEGRRPRSRSHRRWRPGTMRCRLRRAAGRHASGTNTGDYTLVYTGSPSDFTVTHALLTVTASSGSMNYGAAPPVITPGYFGFVNGNTPSSLTTPPTCSTAATSSSPVSGSPYVSSCAGAVDSNYSFSYLDGSVTVSPVPLTITASSPAMTYGGTVPAITAGYAGFVNGDTASSLLGQADLLDDGHRLGPRLSAHVPVLVLGRRRPQLHHRLRRRLGDGRTGPP